MSLQTWSEHAPNQEPFLRLVKRKAPAKRGFILGRLLCRWGLHAWAVHYTHVQGGRWNEYTITRVCKRCRLERTDHGDRGAF